MAARTHPIVIAAARGETHKHFRQNHFAPRLQTRD